MATARHVGTAGWIFFINFAHRVKAHNNICLVYTKFNALSYTFTVIVFLGGPIALHGLVHFLNTTGPSLTKVVYAYIDRIHAGLQSAVLFRRVFFANCEHTQNIDIFPRLTAFLRLPKTVPKSPFEPCLKHILRNLQCFKPWAKTLTNERTRKKPNPQWTANKP